MKVDNLKKANILIVDDELLVAADIKRVIEKAGHNVIGTAINANEAIDYVKSEDVNLVLMDIKLKHDVDGISAAEMIQTIGDIPIIFLTAYSDQETFNRAKKIGPFGYLIKPFNGKELTIAVENALYKHSIDKQLKDNEKKFRLFYENSPIPYHSLTMDGKILEVNNAWLDELGYLKEYVIGKNIGEFLTITSKTKLKHILREFKSKGEVKSKECEFKHKNGTIILMSVTGKVNKNENGEYIGTNCVMHNITERKRTEVEVKETKEKFETIFKLSPSAIVLSDALTGAFLDVNDAFERLTGYKKEEVIGKNSIDLKFFNSEIERYIFISTLRESGFYENKDFFAPIKNGEKISCHLSANLVEFSGKKYIITLIRDMSDIKRSDEIIKEAKDKFESIFKLSPYAICITDFREGLVIDINEAFEELTGYLKDEVIGKTTITLNMWEDPSQRSQLTSQLIKEGTYSNNETGVLKRNGERIDCAISAKIIEISGKPHILSVIKDISEQRHSENALRESENKMKSIFKAAPIGIGVVVNRVIMQVNEEYCRMTGYELSELIGKNSRMIYPTDEDFEYVGTEKYRQIAEKGSGSVETKWRRKDGSIFDVFLSSTPIDPGMPEAGTVFTAQDITEQKKMENALRKSETKSKELLDNLVSGIMIVDTDGIWQYLNKKAAESLGGDPKDYIGKNIFDYLPKNVENLSFINSNTDSNSIGITIYETSFNLSGNGEKHYLFSDQILKDDYGNPSGILSNFLDITSRKQIEEALRLSEEKYRYLFNVNHDAIIVYPVFGFKVGKIIEVNETASLLFGYCREEFLNLTIYDLDKGITEKEVEIRKNAFQTVGKILFETKAQTKNGNILDVEVSAFALRYQGQPVVMSLIRDITEKKKAEAEIREREAKFRAFMNNLQGVAYIKDSNSRYLFVNRKIQDLYNIKPTDWIGKNDMELQYFPSEVIKEVSSNDQLVYKNNMVLETIEHIPVNQEIHYWKTIKFPLLIGESTQKLMAGIAIDVTAEKRLEMAMNTVIALNHELDELTIDDILRRCVEACETSTNSKISFLHFIDDEQKSILLKKWSLSTFGKCDIEKIETHYSIDKAGVWIDCIHKKEPIIYNDFASTKNKKGFPKGHVDVKRMLTVPIFEEDKIVAIVGVGNKEVDYEILDVKVVEIISNNVWKIIRRKKTEGELKNSLAEKETLLRELYHRTKNNMQVISSMLLLQTMGPDDPHLNRVLIETSNRIKAMALVHEKLYQSKNLSKINLKEYIFDLISLLAKEFNINREIVDIKLELSDIFVLIDYAIPCGLVINEILLNMFKYSFTDRDDSKLLIKLFRDEKDQIVFISNDCRKSFPLDQNEYTSNSFGMELIKTIVEHQLGGQLELQNNKGIYIKFSFSDNQYKSRV